MNRLSEFFKGLNVKWKGFSTSRKVALSIFISIVIVALVYLLVVFSTPKYAMLFSGMDSTDSGNVITKLKALKVSYNVKGNAIYVPQSQVDEVRMEVTSSVALTDGSQGWSLLDTTQFGTTDQQMTIDYQRALQGEIEKTIKTFPQVEGARVLLVMPDDSVFVSDKTNATASVYLSLKAGKTINTSQVKAIVTLISGSVKNLPKESVTIVDNNMKLLTANLFTANGSDSTGDMTSVQNQQDQTSAYEKGLEAKILTLLRNSYPDISVKVNADLDYNDVQSKTTTYAPNGTIRSEHDTVTSNPNGTTPGSGSPVDSSMLNATPTTTVNGTTISSDVTKNNEISSTETSTINAPGTVKRVTASVLLNNGALDNATKATINNVVATAIGFQPSRGDAINIDGLKFSNAAQGSAQAEIAQLANEAKQEQLMRYIRYGLFAAGGLLVFILLLRLTKGSKNNIVEDEKGGLDVMIDDSSEDELKKQLELAPINFDVQDQKSNLENQIKKYAMEKPEQVVDIIKSWITEDER